MAYFTMLMVALPFDIDALMLCLVGGWVSILGYRRPMLFLLDRSFKVADLSSFDRDSPKLAPLSRRVATEPASLATLMPLALTDVAVPHDLFMYCAIASNEKGAILRTEVKPSVAKAVWVRGRSERSRLLTPLEVTEEAG